MSTELALIKRDTVDIVAAKVRQFQESRELILPQNYAVENAMKSAWLILQSTVDKDKRPVLQACTRDSIANSLLDMVVQGLNPAKKQCYFIAYGNQLVCQRSYHGTMAVTKRVASAKEIDYQVVYGGDEFEYEIVRGKKYVRKHVQKIENVKPDNIAAAYCTVEFADGREHTEIMTWDQIQRAWSKSKMNPNSADSTHKTFPDQMALKSIINRTCKPLINSSSDDHLFLHHFNRADDEGAELEVEAEALANANGEVVDLEPVILGDAPAEAAEAPAAEQAKAQAAPAQTPVAQNNQPNGAPKGKAAPNPAPPPVQPTFERAVAEPAY